MIALYYVSLVWFCLSLFTGIVSLAVWLGFRIDTRRRKMINTPASDR